MSQFQGTVIEVSVSPTGSSLAVAANAGDTILTLENAQDFEPTGGTISLEDQLYVYLSCDYDQDLITLASPLTTGLTLGASALVSPASTAKWALVVAAEWEDAIRVRVPHSLADKLIDGIREEDDKESVLFQLEHSEWVLFDIMELEPQIDGAFIREGTMPPVDLSDGNAPAISPTPTVIGSVGNFFLRWDAVLNHDPVTYDVYASISPVVIASADNYVASTSATSMSAKTWSSGNATFAYDTDYWFMVVAKDEDGPAPLGGVVGPYRLMKINTPDIATEYVYAGTVFADQIQSGQLFASITISGSLATAAEGQRSIIDTFGIRQFGPDGTTLNVSIPNDPGQTSVFRGAIEASTMVVRNNLEIRGTNNYFGPASIVTLATTSESPSTPPTLNFDYEQVTKLLRSSYGYTPPAGYQSPGDISHIGHRESDTGAPFGWSDIDYTRQWVAVGRTHFDDPVSDKPFVTYRWPRVANDTGTQVSSRLSGNSAGLRNSVTMVTLPNGQKRLVAMGLKTIAGSAPVAGWSVLDVSAMTPDDPEAPNGFGIPDTTIQPPEVWTDASTTTYPLAFKFGGAFPYRTYTSGFSLGRCISPASAPASLQNQFAELPNRRVGLTEGSSTANLRRYQVSNTGQVTLEAQVTVNLAQYSGGYRWWDDSDSVVYGNAQRMGLYTTDANLMVWVVFNQSVTNQAHVFPSAGGAEITSMGFPLLSTGGGNDHIIANGSLANGVNGFTRFENVSSSIDSVARLTNIDWAPGESSKWWVAYTWVDTNSTGGLHESKPGKIIGINAVRHARLTVSSGALPDPSAGIGAPRGADDPNAFRVYMTRGNGAEPASTALWKQTLQPDDLATFMSYSVIPVFAGTTPPPLTNSFAISTPALLKSAGVGADGQPRFRVDGNGDARFEDLEVFNSLVLGSLLTDEQKTLYFRRLRGGTAYEALIYALDATGDVGALTQVLKKAGAIVNRLDIYEERVDIMRGLRVLGTPLAEAVGGTFTTTQTGVQQSTALPGVAFVAPPTGKVRIMVSGFIRSATLNTIMSMQPEIRTGDTVRAGTVVRPANVSEALANYNVAYIGGSYQVMASGLTPGGSYNAYCSVNCGAVGGIATNTRIAVEAMIS